MAMAEGKVGAVFRVDEAVFARAAGFLVAGPFRPEGFDVIVMRNVCRFDIGSLGRLGTVRKHVLNEGGRHTFVFFDFFFLRPSSSSSELSSPSESFSLPRFCRPEFSKHITELNENLPLSLSAAPEHTHYNRNLYSFPPAPTYSSILRLRQRGEAMVKHEQQ